MQRTDKAYGLGGRTVVLSVDSWYWRNVYRIIGKRGVIAHFTIHEDGRREEMGEK